MFQTETGPTLSITFLPALSEQRLVNFQEKCHQADPKRLYFLFSKVNTRTDPCVHHVPALRCCIVFLYFLILDTVSRKVVHFKFKSNIVQSLIVISVFYHHL